jgi:CHAT domain-containing protein/tetratricopeptide (TPR) repeat protein
VPVTKTSPSEIIHTAQKLRQAGVDASCASRQREALRLLRLGMELLDSIHPVAPEHHDDWLRTRVRLSSSLAFVESEEVGFAEGLARLDDVRTLVQTFADPSTRAELTGPLDHNAGLLLMGAGRNEDSLAYFDASIAHQESRLARVVDPATLIEPFLNTLSTTGRACTRLGDVGRARTYLNKAIRLAEEYELPIPAADIRRSLGTLELRVGNVPAALRYYNESERAYRQRGLDVPAPLWLDHAEALLTAGLANEAGELLDVVIAAMREQRSAPRELAYAELFRAAAGLLRDEVDLARRLARSAQRRIRRWGCQTCVANAAILGLRADVRDALLSGDVPARLPGRAVRLAESMSAPRLAGQAAVARMLAARLETWRGNLQRAVELLQQVPRPSQLTPIDYRMLRRLCQAELAATQGRKAKALAEISCGLTELDRVRDRMGGLELVSGTALHGQQLGELAVRLVLADRNPRRLFDWLERTRAQTYRYEPVAVADPELAERVAELRSLTQSIHQARHDGHPTAELRAKHAERLREVQQLGWHAGQRGKPRPAATLPDVAEQLGRQALVSFAASKDQLVAVVVIDGEARTFRLGSASDASNSARILNADVNALAPDDQPAQLAEVIARSARKQADLLDAQSLAPLARLLGDRDLIVVPTGALYAVPWGVLPSLRSRSVVVAPSATAWLAARRAGSSALRKVVLVRGPGLPAALAEIDKLALHHRNATQKYGPSATIKSVLRALDGAKLAHIAAHGAHEPENVLFSRLELTDGALFAHEIAGLRRPPRQVVLAACELALNRIRAGNEPLGFASALLASGSQTVIAPLSKVGDQASAAAMDDYHRGLASGASPAVALADAVAVDPMRRPFVCLGTG